MMQPMFDDVIEYVKAGEDDPGMEEALHRHPDGQELLKQARFICKVLEHQSESSNRGNIAASIDRRASGPRQAEGSALSALRLEQPARRMYSEAPPPRHAAKKRTPSIRDLIEKYGRGSKELGTLKFAAEGETVSVSYQASDSAKVRYGKVSAKYRFAQEDIEGIVIHGSGVMLTLSDKLEAGQPATIRVTRSLKGLPARHFQLIFMPDSGPFQVIKADVDGFIELPAPDKPGMILIEKPSPQLLHIKIKK